MTAILWNVFLLGVGGVRGSDCGSDADWEERRQSTRPRVAADFVDGDRSFGNGVRVDATNHAGEYVWRGSVAENGERGGAGRGAGDSIDSGVYVGKIIQCKRGDSRVAEDGAQRTVSDGAASFLLGIADGVCSDWNSFAELDQFCCGDCADDGGANLSDSGGGNGVARSIWRGIRRVHQSDKEAGSWTVLRNRPSEH